MAAVRLGGLLLTFSVSVSGKISILHSVFLWDTSNGSSLLTGQFNLLGFPFLPATFTTAPLTMSQSPFISFSTLPKRHWLRGKFSSCNIATSFSTIWTVSGFLHVDPPIFMLHLWYSRRSTKYSLEKCFQKCFKSVQTYRYLWVSVTNDSLSGNKSVSWYSGNEINRFPVTRCYSYKLARLSPQCKHNWWVWNLILTQLQ